MRNIKYVPGATGLKKSISRIWTMRNIKRGGKRPPRWGQHSRIWTMRNIKRDALLPPLPVNPVGFGQ